ncbi:MAG: histidine phosphatase family protein [Atopobiaceae bacterium]|nr:histidine phosphatase family protein [Atopobiaceae bacterium]
MSLTLILVRHGKAEDPQFEIPDRMRSLTQKGMQALSEKAQQIASLIETSDAAELWVSPALRAEQTAEILNDALGIENVSERDYLFEQDLGAFVEELADSDVEQLVVVGHIPFMNRLFYYLTGLEMPFATGSVAALDIEDKLSLITGTPTGEPVAELLWFVS